MQDTNRSGEEGQEKSLLRGPGSEFTTIKQEGEGREKKMGQDNKWDDFFLECTKVCD